MIAPGTKQTDQSTEISLTDIGSLIVEMRHLSRVTHDSQYADRMDTILLSLSRLQPLMVFSLIAYPFQSTLL